MFQKKFNYYSIVSLLTLAFIFCSALSTFAQQPSPDERAEETEKKMTDEERFSMIWSVIGSVPSIGMPRDSRIPEGVNMSAGYTPGVPRLNIITRSKSLTLLLKNSSKFLTSGGQVDDCLTENITIEADYADELHIALPEAQSLKDINLNQPMKQ